MSPGGDDATFALIAAERKRLADQLADLDPDQWATPSLCDGWTVHDVAAHLLMPLVTSMPSVAWAMLRNRGDFDRANVDLTAAVARRPSAELVAGLRRHAESRFTPPRLGPMAPLTDVVVHGQDIRRPLGLADDVPVDVWTLVLAYLVDPSARGFVPRSRVSGLALRATDADWSAGDGDGLSGTAEALTLALAGRGAALADLFGPGADVLAGRLSGR